MASDNVIYFMIAYLLIGSFLIGSMPDSFFTGNLPELDKPDKVDASGTINTSQISFIGKVLTFLFVGITIDGLPVILAGLLNIMNLIFFVMTTVWVINKARGVS